MGIDKIGCVVIGAGSWGGLIAAAINDIKDLELLGVLDSSDAHASAVTEILGGRSFSSLDEVLSVEDVQAVAIAIPNDLHADYALAALSARKHVLLEKPMALTISDAQAIEALALKHELVLMLDHIQRYFPPLVQIKQLVDQHKLGDILAVSVSRRDLLIRTKAWLQQRQHVGGLLYQSACHEFDFLRWLCGDAAEIYCQTPPRIIASESLDYPDTILSQIRFVSGVVAHVWNCMTDPLMGYDGVITGTRGTAWFDLYGGRMRWRDLDGEGSEQIWSPPDQWSAPAAMAKGHMPQGEIDALHALIQNFANVIKGIDQPSVTGNDGARAIEMAQAGYLSLSEGRSVALPLLDKDRNRTTYLEVSIGGKS